MELSELQRVLEAILFAAGEPVEISRLSAVLEVDEKRHRIGLTIKGVPKDA